MHKVRGLRAEVAGPTGDPLTVDALIEQLRTVGQPRERPLMPSPFSVPAQPEAPAVEPPVPAA